MPRFYLITPPKSVTYVLNLLCYLCSESAPEKFRELRVYQAAREAARRIFAISKTFGRPLSSHWRNAFENDRPSGRFL
jgi:hypothetical protein